MKKLTVLEKGSLIKRYIENSYLGIGQEAITYSVCDKYIEGKKSKYSAWLILNFTDTSKQLKTAYITIKIGNSWLYPLKGKSA